ncbi:poly(A) RNA polymerase gld-2 homolog B-like isoform X2 [Sitodiplosis mosellana]|nr:poly(A) RNA polymerase gld-2 homolog B-like isoform X2 [Sitodiplosis mosellana]
MDIRSARLMIPHPAVQHNQPPMSLLSPSAKSLYNLEYLHQVGSQISDRYRSQQNDFYSANSNSNGNRLSYSNERNNGSRYNNSNANNNGNKYTNKSSSAQASNTSASPPLSITSSGSCTTSSKNGRTTSKSFNGNNTMNSVNTHRNMPTTPTIQQSHNGYFQSQNIPFFHSNSSNGMQQMFSSAMSPSNQSQHSNQSVGLYVQQNSSSAYHPNNNYHNHNRNYSSNSNGNGNKKNWNYYSKSKSEVNGNYSSSNSSTTSSTHSTGKTNLSKSTLLPPRNDTPPSATESSIKKPNASDKLPVKKLANKSTQVESPPPSLKTFSLSDSETCNSKVKQLPPNDYFRFPKSKASSSPVISANSPTMLSDKNSPKRMISHTFLASIDKDTLKKSEMTPAHHSSTYEKSEKSSFNQNQMSFLQNQRTDFSMSSRYISTGSMLTEEMLLNGSLSRLRYMNPQNMHLLSEANVWATSHLGNTDCFTNSPARVKNFVPSVAQQKRRSGTSSSATVTRKPNDFETQRATQYRNRVSEVKIPSDLCNGTEWDTLSQKIWAKFDERRQPQELYEKKILLWVHLCQQIKTIFSRYSLYLVGSTVSGFALDSSDVDMCLVSRLSTNLDHRAEAFLHLDKLRAHLQEHCQSFLRNFNLIPAKVPILRFDDVHHSFEVDLNYNNCVGIRNSHLLYCYTQLDWRLQPLAVIVKLWAQHHDINNAKDLTISSYSLILMVIHYLQCGVQPAILPCLHAIYPDKFNKINGIETINMNDKIEPYHSDNKQTLGELFFGFLEYYCTFSFEKYAISVRTAGLLKIEDCRGHKSFKNDPTEWKQLCIEEPFDRSNTARSCCDEKIFERIKKIFHESWLLLRQTKDLDRLFSEPLVPPAFCTFYDNYTPILYQPMDYILR